MSLCSVLELSSCAISSPPCTSFTVTHLPFTHSPPDSLVTVLLEETVSASSGLLFCFARLTASHSHTLFPHSSSCVVSGEQPHLNMIAKNCPAPERLELKVGAQVRHCQSTQQQLCRAFLFVPFLVVFGVKMECTYTTSIDSVLYTISVN